jgi:hypothetical protein
VTSHLQACASCREEVRRLQDLEVLLQKYLPVIETSPTFASRFANRLAAEIAAEEERESRPAGVFGRLLRPWLIPVAAAAALTALVVTQWLPRQSGTGLGLPQAPSVAASKTKSSTDTKLAAGAKSGGDVKVAAAKPATSPPPANVASAANPASPPDDVVRRPELFVDYAVIRDLDVLDRDGADGTG